MSNRNELLAILQAYQIVVEVALPDLFPNMRRDSLRWSSATDGELRRTLIDYFAQASDATFAVRLFYKTGPSLIYGGCNRQFVEDAGLSSPSELVGLNDFSPRISWASQAAKYRSDDKKVIKDGLVMLGIVERQSSASGVVWLETSKVPIIDGVTPIGVFGAYEIIDSKVAWQRNLNGQNSSGVAAIRQRVRLARAPGGTFR